MGMTGLILDIQTPLYDPYMWEIREDLRSA